MPEQGRNSDGHSTSERSDQSFDFAGKQWRVALSAAVVHMLHAASVYFAPIVLMSPMRHDLGLTVAEIALPVNVYRIVNAIVLVPAGHVLDRVGPVKALRYSITAAALLGLLYPFSSSLLSLTTLQALFAITKVFGGLSSMIMIISNAFESRRGLATAISILLGGFSLAGFIAPAIVGLLYGRFGWRVSCATISVIFAAVAIPLTLLHLGASASYVSQSTSNGIYIEHARGSSSSRQLHQYSLVDEENVFPQFRITSRKEDTPHSLDEASQEIVFSKSFFWVLFIVASFSFSLHIILDHLLVFLREDTGLSFETSAWFMSLLNLLAFVTKLVVGPLADWYDKGSLMIGFSTLGIVSTLLLFDSDSKDLIVPTSDPAKVLAFVITYSIGYAALYCLTTSVLPSFGQQRLGLRSNISLMLLFGSGSVGSCIAAILKTKYGSYLYAFMLSTATWLLTLVFSICFFAQERLRSLPGHRISF